MFKELLNKKRAEFKSITEKRDALLTKGDELAVEDLTQVETYNTELRGIAEEIKRYAAAEKDTVEMRELVTDPILQLNLGTNNPDAPKVVGVTKGGYTDVDRHKDGVDILHMGEGCLTQKQLLAISQPGYLKSFYAYLRAAGILSHMEGIDRKTLNEGIDDAGGFLVPAEMLFRLLQKQPAPTRLNGLVDRLQTSRNALTIPRVIYNSDDIYTTGIRATLSGELPSSTMHRVVEPVFGQVRIDMGTWMLSLPIGNDFIEDSAVPVLPWASNKFSETIDLLFDHMIVTGPGVGAYPHGLLLNPGGTDQPGVVLSSTADNIDAEQLRGMPFDVPEQYINENTRWVMNRASAGRKVATMRAGGSSATDGPFLFLEGQTYPGLVGRSPDQLAGYPIAYSAFMPNIGNGAFPLIFGDLRGWMLVARIGFSIQMIREKYAEENLQVMLGRLRWGGKTIEPYRMKIGKSDNS